MPQPGDIVIVDFVGAQITKRRPAVVVSTALYHAHRPDIIVGLLTTNVSQASGPTDCILQDWAASGLRQPTAFRSYLLTMDNDSLSPIGQLSARDWQNVQTCLARALAVSPNS